MSAGSEPGREAFLLAFPAGHSLSPAMHQAAFAHLGMPATYRALEVAPERLAEVVASLRAAPSFLGANVTVPHKRSIMPLLDDVTAEAQSIGAVNTLTLLHGRLVGSNTDAEGFARALGELLPASARRPGGQALLLGAGGSARAVAWALLREGFRVGVHARRHQAAVELSGELGGAEPVPSGELAAWFGACEVLVNSTPVGMAGGPDPHGTPAPQPLSTLPSGAVVMDLVYRPAVTPLLAEAQRLGLKHANGLAMLVWQGAASFETWTGEVAPAAVMRAAAAAASR